MRQLTSLDAQFLAMESAGNYGHVGGLAVYDPSTTAWWIFVSSATLPSGRPWMR